MKKILGWMLIKLGVVLLAGILLLGFFDNSPPSPTVTAGSKTIPTAQSTYCWNRTCADYIAPPMLVKEAPVKVSPNEKLKIEFNDPPIPGSLGADLWTTKTDAISVKISENIMSVPEEKGVYIYSIHANWNKGSSSYAFTVEVQ